MVLEADTSAVFLADLQMVSGIPKVQQLWRDTTNAPAEYIDKHMAKGLTVSVGCTVKESFPFDPGAICQLHRVACPFLESNCLPFPHNTRLFQGGIFDVGKTVEVLVFSWSLTITHPPVGAIARCILSKGSFDNSLNALRPLDPSVREV